MKKRTITYNFTMNAVLTCSNILFPMITYPYVSRILKPYGMGTVSFANAIITYFTMFAQLGIPTYGIQICAKVRDNKEELSRTVQEIMIINAVTCFVSYGIFLLAVFFTPQLRSERTLFLIMGMSIIFNTIGVEWLYKGLEEYSYITIRSIVFKVLALIGIFCFVHNSSDYIIYGFLTIFALSGSYAINFLNLRKKIYITPIGDYHFKRHLKSIVIFFGMSVATTIYTNMDSVMLGFIKGAEENGCYDAAVKIKNLLVSLVTSLGTVLLPRVSYYWEKGKKEIFWELANKAIRFEIIAGGGLAVFFMIFACPTIYIVSGELYKRAIIPMQIIMPTLLLIGISTVTGIQVMVPVGMEKQVLYSEIAGAGVNLIVNAILIPRWGAIGAAIGTLTAEVVVLLYQIVALKARAGELFCGFAFGKIVTAIGGAALAGMLLQILISDKFLCLVLGGMVFFICYGIVLLMLKEATTLFYWEQIRKRLSMFHRRG